MWSHCAPNRLSGEFKLMCEITCGLVPLRLLVLGSTGETAVRRRKSVVLVLWIPIPQDALNALLAKWIVRAFIPDNSNLHHLLGFKLRHSKPCNRGKWPTPCTWSLLSEHKKVPGSKLWQRITKAWKKMLPSLTLKPPTTRDSALNQSLWFSTSFSGSQFGFTPERAAELASSGMCLLRDI